MYVAWSGYSYGRRGYGVADEAAMRRRFAAIEVAVKNQDNREHDIFDSDDYLQDHGGMVATVRSLTGTAPKAWLGDSADPAVRKFFEQSNPWALKAIAERLLEAHEREMWAASPESLAALRSAVLEAEGWEESR